MDKQLQRLIATSVVAGLLAVSALPGRALAHHSYSTNYDSSRTINLTGVIRQVNYGNPHVRLQLEVPGNPRRTWAVDLPSPPRAQRLGLTREALRVGDTITVVGWPTRDRSNEVGGVALTLPGNRTIRVRTGGG